MMTSSCAGVISRLAAVEREKRQLASELRESRRRVEQHEGVGSAALVPGGAEERTLQLLRQTSAADESASSERRAHLRAAVRPRARELRFRGVPDGSHHDH